MITKNGFLKHIRFSGFRKYEKRQIPGKSRKYENRKFPGLFLINVFKIRMCSNKSVNLLWIQNNM